MIRLVGRARARANALVRANGLALARANGLALTRANANANALARANALANALALARDLASDLDNAEVLVGTLARANALTLGLANASALNLDHTLDLDHALNHSRALTHALTHASDFARTRAGASNLDLDLARDFARARASDLACDLVRDLADLDPAAHWARALAVAGARSMPGRVSRGLVALAVRMLPAPQRPRYCGEFRVESVELPPRERLGYSLRVLASAWELRRALGEAGCTPDGAAARRAER